MTEFMNAPAALAGALTERGYTAFTPVQSAVLEDDARGADLLVSAQTGSGKTVAFGLALADTLLGDADTFAKAGAPMALCVAPTRELALQVKRELEWLYAKTGARTASCVGGMDMRQERRTLDFGAHIVVGTPGRLRDHIERGSLDLSDIKAVVLDEADEMLDLGFREDLEFILDAAPSERRTLMFSATVPRTIANMAKRYQRDALRISTIAENEQHLDIEYRALTVAPNDRENAIINVLRYYDASSAMVFCSTRVTVTHLASRFANRGFAVVALSGELTQSARTHALQAMRDGRAKVCIATDVAARGIDLPNLDLVIHADLPNNGATLLHRSGRTGRAGRKGVCALVVPHTRRRMAERLLQTANVTADWAKPPSAQDILDRDRERMFSSAVLQDEPNEDELAFAQELLGRYSPTRIAAAFYRLHAAAQPAPEELIDTPAPGEREKKQRRDFTGGQWFKINTGRKHGAEPRWLLPMLCRHGHITKNEIGAIKVLDTRTLFEISADASERFFDAIQHNGTGEKSLIVTRDGGPGDRDDALDAPAKPRKSYKPKATYDPLEQEPVTEPDTPPRTEGRPWQDKGKPKFAKGGKPKFDKPKYEKRKPAKADNTDGGEPRATDDKPKAKTKFKPKGKPGFKSAPFKGKTANSGSRPLKRKTRD
ncbi:MAG: DEAD/DEAH box helicase [Alphaproteobacteria bacterium]|nr:DEAD/DEAH box helicase [Alphaproteobacteria bacterium]MBF0251789.1 DEAD/DEAH box helicase [Alphaproteobacteria bacterium]